MAPKLTRERRTIGVELRAEGDGDGQKIVGYAAKFDRESQDLGGFVEVIRPGAFRTAIAEDDVRALFNHDSNWVLGRNKAGTLRMVEDAVGLRIEIDPPDAQWARDLVGSIARGDVDQMSFAFSVRKDAWTVREGESPDLLRELLDVRLYDVSPVTYPAYLDTEVGVRDLIAGRDLTDAERVALRDFLDDAPASPAETGSRRSLDHMRRRLDLQARA